MSVAARTRTLKPSPPARGGLIARTLGNERLVLALVGVAAVLAAWEIGSRLGYIDEAFFSRPTQIVEAGMVEIGKPRFWVDFKASLSEFAIGYIAAIVTGIPIGLAAGMFRRLSYALDPWLNFFNALPRVALLPVLVIMFGVFGPGSKIAVVFLGAFFAIVIPTVQGVRTVDRRFLDVARSFRAPQRMVFTSVVVPSTVPFLVTGLRLGVARALIGVVTAELYTQTEGLGVIIRRASEAREGDRMLFVVLIFTFAGIIGVESIRRLESRFQRWRPSNEVRR